MVRRPRLPGQYTPTHTVTGSLPTILSLGFNPYGEQSCDFSVPSAILLLLRRRGGGGGRGKLVDSRLFFLQTVITQNSKSSRFCNMSFFWLGMRLPFEPRISRPCQSGRCQDWLGYEMGSSFLQNWDLRWLEPICLPVQWLHFWVALFGRKDLTDFFDFWHPT